MQAIKPYVLLSAVALLAGGGVDAATLRDARAHTEKHENLLVRVGGFSAPFVLLSADLQDNIIERTEHKLA